MGQGSDDEEEEQFDTTLPATHSYLSASLVAVQGRSVLEAGWEGWMPCWGHHGVVFPGEIVPMMCMHPQDISALHQAIDNDRLFGLLCPDETGMCVSGYGILCEVFEATEPGQERMGRHQQGLSFKARARQRFKMLDSPPAAQHLHQYLHITACRIKILPEVLLGDPLYQCRLSSLDTRRHFDNRSLDVRIRKTDAVMTPWPLFLYEIFDVHRTTKDIKKYFRQLSFESFPREDVSFSFWVATNLSLSIRDRLALFTVDNALLRLHMELQHIHKKCTLCCASCVTTIARRENIFAMSSEGLHSNYCNPGGYVHDIVTLSKVSNVVLSGNPSLEFSWFPGYTWTIAVCLQCGSHLGWRFDSTKKSLRPRMFWGLCRNYITPQEEDAHRRSSS